MFKSEGKCLNLNENCLNLKGIILNKYKVKGQGFKDKIKIFLYALLKVRKSKINLFFVFVNISQVLGVPNQKIFSMLRRHFHRTI